MMERVVVNAEAPSRTYRLVMTLVVPAVRWWGRLDVVGIESIPDAGPVVLFANHDSAWDPLVIGLAAAPRRQVRALAKSSLWKRRPVGWVLDRMGQIPVQRGSNDTGAMAGAIERLRDGACICVFPEGTRSRGRTLRARSGAGRLAQAVPEATIVCAAATGVVDLARFPRRPRVRVEFFAPVSPPVPGESAAALSERITAELRRIAPPVVSGR
jgi:1-acyl-sn-glycerol-3-phosphate acyltransferase